MPATQEADEVVATERPPFWRDVRVLAWAYQIAILGVVVAIIYWLWGNFLDNREELGINTSFGNYLDNPAGFTIPGTDFRTSQPVREALVIGVRNTLYVSAVGIFLATILGVLIGIARLSGNWLVNTGARIYVETLRNIPLLAIITFTYLALVISVFPRIENAWIIGDFAIISNRAAAIPWYDGSALWLIGSFLGACLAAWGLARWRTVRADHTGATAYTGLWGFGGFIVVLVGGCLIGGVGVTTPSLDGRSTTGGIEMTPEYLALLIALTIYTASHIAEIVRGSIQAVAKGQGEAADALALSGPQRMWYIVLPQAMRIAIPPLGNQYLNLFKNSSLGVVISYFELTKVTGTAVGNGRAAVPAVALLMLMYLIGSLIISQVVNLVNRRLQLVD